MKTKSETSLKGVNAPDKRKYNTKTKNGKTNKINERLPQLGN